MLERVRRFFDFLCRVLSVSQTLEPYNQLIDVPPSSLSHSRMVEKSLFAR